jgi:diadenosine tetraphosphatase ApaH/serine/threonine PP2A family protein phosphatase
VGMMTDADRGDGGGGGGVAPVRVRAYACVQLGDVMAIDRFQEIPSEGPMCDLLWSDPYDESGDSAIERKAGAATNRKVELETLTAAVDWDDPNWYVFNDARQCSVLFGYANTHAHSNAAQQRSSDLILQ